MTCLFIYSFLLIFFFFSDEFTCESNDDFMIKLFERAVKDFHCPNLYVEFVKFACGVSINYAREVN